MSSNNGAGAVGPVVTVSRLELAYAPQPWPFAIERRAEIDAHFEEVRTEQAGIWNGQVLMMHRHRLEHDALVGAFLSTDFASFLAWRNWGFPETGIINCFSMGALRTSDDAWIMGVMAPHTSAAGKIYFPAGTPDPGDVVEGMVDLKGSVIREVAEETGLGPADFTEVDGWHCVFDGARIALMKVLQANDPADMLRRRILDYLARDSMPELADIRIVRSRDDFDPMMPRFVTTFVEHAGFNHIRS
jgi:8-oxo-dGTP pyrophosphatase MutT (NUDIX family)